jgi:hypothetical protein
VKDFWVDERTVLFHAEGHFAAYRVTSGVRDG